MVVNLFAALIFLKCQFSKCKVSCSRKATTVGLVDNFLVCQLGRLAQPVEHLTLNQMVAGSIPASPIRVFTSPSYLKLRG